MSQNYILNVCIPCRDRIILTQKSIESIHKNSSTFNKINIYLYDNISELDIERITIFSQMLKENKIVYYSYDTQESTSDCFTKPIIFSRWCTMMIEKSEIEKKNNMNKDTENVYLLSDNDMIYGKDWDTYFISTLEKIPHLAPTTKYIVKYPGGIPRAAKEQAVHKTVKNRFKSDEEFQIINAKNGGGSGCWFMNLSMLKCLRWNSDELSKMHKRFKGHDSSTWTRLRRTYGDIAFVTAIIPPNQNEDPLIEHIGGVVGSICNNLVSSDYQNKQEEFRVKDKDLQNKSIDEIFQTYKNFGSW